MWPGRTGAGSGSPSAPVCRPGQREPVLAAARSRSTAPYGSGRTNSTSSTIRVLVGPTAEGPGRGVDPGRRHRSLFYAAAGKSVAGAESAVASRLAWRAWTFAVA